MRGNVAETFEPRCIEILVKTASKHRRQQTPPAVTAARPAGTVGIHRQPVASKHRTPNESGSRLIQHSRALRSKHIASAFKDHLT